MSVFTDRPSPQKTYSLFYLLICLQRPVPSPLLKNLSLFYLRLCLQRPHPSPLLGKERESCVQFLKDLTL
jgi:hypothetical protein